MRKIFDAIYILAGWGIGAFLIFGFGHMILGDFVSGLFEAEATSVKKSRSGICHCPGGRYYANTKTFTAYSTIESCLDSGGRSPKRGQGDCTKATLVPGSPEHVNKVLAEQKDRPDPFEGTALVMDGDTIKINGKKIRMEGIDAPEIGQSCRDRNGKMQPYGEFARAFQHELLFEKKVKCYVSTRDRYGRHLGTCCIRMDINAWMVSMGLALAYRQCSKKYVAEEDDTRATRRGMRQGAFVPPWDWRRGKRLQ